jgi:poly-gamma-glutamate hydrolase-like protein
MPDAKPLSHLLQAKGSPEAEERMIAIPKRRDKYPSFEILCRSEQIGAFRIHCRPRRSAIAIIAPHGGKIEPGTSTIAAAIAGSDYPIFDLSTHLQQERAMGVGEKEPKNVTVDLVKCACTVCLCLQCQTGS